MAKDSMAPPSSARDEDLDTRQLLATTNRRAMHLAMVLGVMALLLIILMMLLLPLKRSVPYVVAVNHKTGAVSIPANHEVHAFHPQWANASFFLRRWVSDLFTINEYLTVNITDPRAQAFLRGSNAISEYNAFRKKDNTFERLAADPSLVRTVQVESLTPVAGTKNSAVAQVELTTHDHGRTTVETRLVTLSYLYINPTDPAVRKRDPIGIYVTNFRISQDGQ